MNGIIEVTIKGKKRALVFNNYARVEIAKVLDTDPLRILDSIQELNNRNHLLLLKTLVYAGHCGDCYRRKDTTDLSKEEVGEWIGEADDNALHSVFATFLEAEGFGLPEDKGKKKATVTGRKTGTRSSSSRSVK